MLGCRRETFACNLCIQGAQAARAYPQHRLGIVLCLSKETVKAVMLT